MSAIGSALEGPALPVQPVPRKGLQDTPEMAFGKAKWEECFGDIGIEPSLPPKIEEILNSSCPFWPGKKVKESHLLVLIPQKVNSKPFDLGALGEMIQTPKTGHKTKYQYYDYDVKKELGKKSEPSHWVLMTRDVIPESRGKSYQEQKSLAEKHAGRNGVAYKMPKALEAATAILIEYASTGTRLYLDDPRVYTRCQEKVSQSRWPVIIGGLPSEGFIVSHCTYADFNGVVACGSLGI